MDIKRPYFSSSSLSIDPEVRKGPWTMEEDLILINYISNHGEGVWNTLAKSAGLMRTGKSCRLRWLNYLRPDVKRGNITPDEQMLILQLHAKWGNRSVDCYCLLRHADTTTSNESSDINRFRWSKIAKHLPGRTDNEIKNYWRTRIQKYINKQDDENQHQEDEDTQLMRCEMSTTTTTAASLVPIFDNHQAYYSPQQLFSFPSGNLETYPNGITSDLNDNMWNMDEFD